MLILVEFFYIPSGYHLIWCLSQEVSLVPFTLHRSPSTRKQLYRRLQPAYISAVQRPVIGITMARAECAPDDQSDNSITSLPQRSWPCSSPAVPAGPGSKIWRNKFVECFAREAESPQIPVRCLWTCVASKLLSSSGGVHAELRHSTDKYAW